MKVKVSKKELYEAIESAVKKAINEKCEAPNGKKMHKVGGKKKEKYPNKWDDEEYQEKLNEWYDDDDDEDDAVSRFLKDKKNQIPKRIKGGNAARKAAQADIKKELDAEKRDDDTLAAREKSVMSED